MTAAIQQGPRKILDIECLRAIAILFTLVAHIQFLYNEQPGWLVWLLDRLAFWGGVDLFFVISGFVICKNLIPQWRSLPPDASGRLQFLCAFWLRRVCRLLPAAWFWAFVSLAIVGITRQASLRTNVFEVIAALLQVYNVQGYLCSLGRATCSHAAVGVYWSLSLEEQIYVVLPVVMAFWKRKIGHLFVGMLAVALACEIWAPQFSAYIRFDGFCWGMLVALLYDQPRLHALFDGFFLRPIGRLKYLATALIIVALPVIGKGAILPSLRYPLTAVCGAALVLIGSYDRNYLGVPSVLRGTLVYLGARSYSIYLIHRPVFSVLKIISGGREREYSILGEVSLPILALVVTVGLSELSFRFIEQRWRYNRQDEHSRDAVKMVASIS